MGSVTTVVTEPAQMPEWHAARPDRWVGADQTPPRSPTRLRLQSSSFGRSSQLTDAATAHVLGDLSGDTDRRPTADLHRNSRSSPCIRSAASTSSGPMTMTETAAFGGMTADEAKALTIRSMQIMVDGSREDFDAVVHAEAINREGEDEPPESHGRGPAAFYATARWLRAWFDDLAFEIHEVIRRGRSRRPAQHDVRTRHRTRGVLRRGRWRRPGHAGHGQAVRSDADALAAAARREGRRALGEP